ncbi:MFS transporter [Micromonospora sp. WMMD734]|uniref:MFS transporter n=1 Tax=unclassified Micromonospora TaxID=2617518 RepID=UPI00249A4F5E|nr:MFS transporter [Micromonospora sp. WMMD712]WFE59493.1 MFS transporter [Micromonospora sp. WMMD712]
MSVDAAVDEAVEDAERSSIPADIWVLYAARILSLLGNYLQYVALPLWVLSVTGSAVATGLTFAIEVMPVVFLAPWVGYLVDKYDRRNLLVAAEALSAVAVGGLLLAVGNGFLPLVYLAVLVIRVFDTFAMPASTAILNSRVPKAARPRAIATLEAMFGGMMTLGPIAGSLVYGAAGIKVLLIVNLASFVVSSVLTAFLPSCPAVGVLAGVRAALVDAVRSVAADRRLRLASLVEISYFLCCGGLTTLAVVIAEGSIGADLSGLYVGGLGFGWLVCSLFVVRRFGGHPRALLLAGAIGCCGVGVVLWQVVALHPVACVLGGMLAGAVNVLIVTATTVVYSDRVRVDAMGRVFAARRAWMNLALALSHGTLAALSTALGPGATAVVAGTAATLAGVVLLSPALARGAWRPGPGNQPEAAC